MIEHSSTVNSVLLHLVNLKEKRDQRVTGELVSMMYSHYTFVHRGTLMFMDMQAIC